MNVFPFHSSRCWSRRWIWTDGEYGFASKATFQRKCIKTWSLALVVWTVSRRPAIVLCWTLVNKIPALFASDALLCLQTSRVNTPNIILCTREFRRPRPSHRKLRFSFDYRMLHSTLLQLAWIRVQVVRDFEHTCM